MIRHETLRVAVCGMLENECNLNMPQELRNIMEKTFLQFYDQYVETAKKHLNLDSKPMLVVLVHKCKWRLVNTFCAFRIHFQGYSRLSSTQIF